MGSSEKNMPNIVANPISMLTSLPRLAHVRVVDKPRGAPPREDRKSPMFLFGMTQQDGAPSR